MSKKSSKTPPPPLNLTEEAIAELADRRSLVLGEQYWKEGAIEVIALDDDRVVGLAKGPESHRAHITAIASWWIATCTCGIDTTEWFCQHCAALAFACANASRKEEKKQQKTIEPMEDLVQALQRMEKEELVTLILSRASVDDSLQPHVLQHVDNSAGIKFDLITYRRMIDRATEFKKNLKYVPDYARNVRIVTESLAGLVNDQVPVSSVLPLIERAIARVERQIGDTKHSSDEIVDALRELTDLHLRACCLTCSDPISLAQHLFTMGRESCSGEFQKAYKAYSDMLGESGRRRYRELAGQAWKHVTSVEDKIHNSWNTGVIAAIMETIAMAEGDVDLLIAAKETDLLTPHRYLEIAEILQAESRSDEALEWAERGVERFLRQQPEVTLVRFLAEEYSRRGRKQDALNAVWNLYAGTPSIEAFLLLKEQATMPGAWESWRSRAIDSITERCEQHSVTAGRMFSHDVDFPSLLVSILIADGDNDAAFVAATEYDCQQDVLLRLAAIRSEDHPRDALAIYREHVEKTAENIGQNAYEDVVDILKNMESICRREGWNSEFSLQVQSLRKKFKGRRRFVEMLDEAFSR